MDTKTSQAIELFKAKNIKPALKIFSTFKLGLTKSERDMIKRGYEALIHPEFYTQLGKDPQILIMDACIFIQKHFITK